MRGGGARGQNVVHIDHQYSKGLYHVFVSSACMEAHTHTYSHTLTVLGRGPDPQCRSALYTLHTHTLRVSALSVCVCVCVCLCVCVCVAKPVAVELHCHATALILVIGKAQLRRAMLSCDSSCLVSYPIGIKMKSICYIGKEACIAFWDP